jgi:hypothetical protein
MSEPRPLDDLDAFAAAYSTAWTKDPVGLLDFFAPAGSYTDMAMAGPTRATTASCASTGGC